MNDTLDPGRAASRAPEAADIAVVLLLVQAVLGLLSFLGMVAVAFLFPVLTPAGLIVLLGFLLPLVFAVGVARGWDWARRGAVIFQAVALLGVCANLLLDLIPQVQMELTLSGLLSGVALPVGLIAMLRRLEVERTAERRPAVAFPAPVAIPVGDVRGQTAKEVA